MMGWHRWVNSSHYTIANDHGSLVKDLVHLLTPPALDEAAVRMPTVVMTNVGRSVLVETRDVFWLPA